MSFLIRSSRVRFLLGFTTILNLCEIMFFSASLDNRKVLLERAPRTEELIPIRIGR